MKKKKTTKTSSSPSPSPENNLQSPGFDTAVARTAVAQICQSVGYKSAQTSALETLTDVAVRYLRSLASAAATSAASTGRTQCNLLDILRALEDLHTYTTGFHGNSNPNRRLSSLTDSSILRETMKFVYWNREIPFAKPLPPRRRRIIAPIPTCFSGESAKPNHVPICRTLPACFSGEIFKPNHIPICRTLPPIPACFSDEIAKPNHIPICHTIPPIPACFSGEIAKPNHVPIWLPDFPKFDDNNGEKSEKTVISGSIEAETESEKKMNSIGKSSVISKLPEKRQKVSFKIGCGGRVRVRNEIETKMELDLRNGICKRGKRISFQIYDDENLLNSSDHGDLKKKFEESRTKMIMMH